MRRLREWPLAIDALRDFEAGEQRLNIYSRMVAHRRGHRQVRSYRRSRIDEGDV